MEKQGIEYSFVNSWSGWDVIDEGVWQFYDATLRTELFKFASPDDTYTVCVNTAECTVEVFDADGDEPIFFSKFACQLV